MSDHYYKSDDQILTVQRSFNPRSTGYDRTYTYIFDFEFKTMMVISGFSDYGQENEKTSVLPFSAADESLLEKMRNKLIELGGKPDALDSIGTKPALAAPKTVKGLNP